MLLRFPWHPIYAATWQSKAEKGEGKHLQGYFLSIICRNEVQGLGFLWCCFLRPFLYFFDHLESYFRTLSDLAHTFSTSTGGPAACIYFRFTCASFMQNHCSNAPGTLQVQFSHSVVSDSLLPHGLHHARLPCPSPTPGACWNSCALSQWCHPTISSSIVPSASCLQSFPALGSFPVSQFFASDGQSIGVLASASVLHIGLISFRIDWFDLLAVQGTLKCLLQHHSSKASILWCSAFYVVQLLHP